MWPMCATVKKGDYGICDVIALSRFAPQGLSFTLNPRIQVYASPFPAAIGRLALSFPAQPNLRFR